MIMEAEKSQYRHMASWKPRRANVVLWVQRQEKTISQLKAVKREEIPPLPVESAFLLYSYLYLLDKAHWNYGDV